MLRSRDSELRAIERLLASARVGRGGGLLLSGEPGVGKSALLAAARALGGDMRVLSATGVESESALGYASLHLLLRPLLECAGLLSKPQARALRVALGLADGDPPDRFLVALATLTLLSEAAKAQPILCLLDDAHWVDTPSIEVIA